MKDTRRAGRLGLLITAGIAASLLLLSGGTARADVDQDADMQVHLARVGIEVDTSTASQTGQDACRYLRADPTYHGVRSALDTYERQFDSYQAGAILGMAAHIYCKDMWPLLDAWSRGEPQPAPTYAI